MTVAVSFNIKVSSRDEILRRAPDSVNPLIGATAWRLHSGDLHIIFNRNIKIAACKNQTYPVCTNTGAHTSEL